MFINPFDTTLEVLVPQDCDIVFVADMFVEDYAGGAELTTQALIDSSPLEVFKIRSNQLTVEHLEKGVDKFWVFGNFANLDHQLIPSIVANMKYAVLEYDYKYCRYRSPEKDEWKVSFGILPRSKVIVVDVGEAAATLL